MKKLLLLLMLSVFVAANGQDSLRKNNSIKDTSRKVMRHEVGFNATLLLKQIFSLSGNNLTLSPYNVTYRFMMKNWALRGGIGVNASNTNNTITTINSQGQTSIQPSVNKSRDVYYRVGIERRYKAARRIVAYAGLDLIGQNNYSYSEANSTFNNLPNSYQSITTTQSTTTNGFGAGFVGGLQLYISRRISVFTEMPVYFLYSIENGRTRSDQQILAYSGANYYYYYSNSSTQTSNSSSITLTLPVTIYLTVKF